MFRRLSGRDKSDDIIFVCVSDNDDAEFQEAKGDVADFTVMEALVLDCEHVDFKHGRHIREINSVLFDVCKSLGFIPFKFHELDCSYDG